MFHFLRSEEITTLVMTGRNGFETASKWWWECFLLFFNSIFLISHGTSAPPILLTFQKLSDICVRDRLPLLIFNCHICPYHYITGVLPVMTSVHITILQVSRHDISPYHYITGVLP